MLNWRRYPPVHAALPQGAFTAGVRALGPNGQESAFDAASSSLARLYPGREIQLVHSGTAALQLLLHATRRRHPEACVALPAYACPDLGSAALGAGFAIRLYDVNPHSLQPDLGSLSIALREGASHVVVAHLFGRIVDVQAVQRIASEFGTVVIEDAAQHAGGSLEGVRGGALAPLSILSFGRGKGLNAGGGGALMWKPDALQDLPMATEPPLASSKVLLAAVAVQALSHPLLYRLPNMLPSLGLGETRYKPPESPRQMTGVSAALLSSTLVAEPAALAARQSVEQWYDSALAEKYERICFRPLHGSVSGALRYPVRIEPARAMSLAALGVARSYPRMLSQYAEIANVLQGMPETPGAAELAASLHTLPTHSLVPMHARKRIVRTLDAASESGETVRRADDGDRLHE